VYAIVGLIFCKYTARITWIKMGLPVSVHYNLVLSNSEIYLGWDKYFNHKEYLPGDSAFSKLSIMVPAFKKGHNVNLCEEKSTSIPIWLKLGSRVSTALVYLKHDSNIRGVISA